MPVVLTPPAAADARISARTTALVESCRLLTRGRVGRSRCNPRPWQAQSGIGRRQRDRRHAKGHWFRVRPFPPRASALRAYDDRQSSRGQGVEAQIAATAVEAWDERWTTPEGRADWLVPHSAVAALVPVLRARGAQHVLDLGCGVGRHALLFAEHGFGVEAIDGAVAGPRLRSPRGGLARPPTQAVPGRCRRAALRR